MKKILLVFLVMIILFGTSCTVGGGSVINYRNDEIDKSTLDSVKVLDDKVIESIKNSNADKILQFSSDALKKDTVKLRELLNSINNNAKDKSFDYQGRYYSKVNTVGTYSFTINTLKDDPYNINLQAFSKDIFVSLIKSNSNVNDFMLSLIYIKENGVWKLNTLYVGDYKYNGMNTIQLYEKAKELSNKGQIVPSGLYLALSNRLLHPAPFLQSKKESEIIDFSKKVQYSIKKNYTFPKKLESTNNIEIYGIDVQCVKEGLVPVIRYTTSTELSNENAITKEANDINKEVITFYPGINESFKSFLYKAYSEPPVDSKKEYNYYGTVVNQN